MAGFTVSGPRIWPVPPDWAGGVSETLAWGTNVQVATATAVSDHIGYVLGPDRALSFEVAAPRAARRVSDMLLAGHRGKWLLPIWPDVQRLAAAVSPGAGFIGCVTVGFDFVAGGQALLWSAMDAWEVVTITSFDSTGLTLTGTLASDWPTGTRLYPLRRARIQDGAEEQLKGGEFSRRRLVFDIDEPCDWPALSEPTLYLTHPVLDSRPDESENGSAAYARQRQAQAFPGAIAIAYDLPDQALRTQKTAYKLFGRARHTWFRSLLYTLRGQAMPMWLPSFADDLKPAATIAGNSTTLSVEWAGYTLFGLGRHNRKDVRIELNGGTVYYRRINNAVEAGDTETLTLDSALDAADITPGQIRQISFMALATLASDSTEIQHLTDADGTATSTLGWQAVVPDV